MIRVGKLGPRRWRVVGLCSVGLLSIGTMRFAAAQATAADRYRELAKTNDIDGKGGASFHLKMTFQLFDIAGKPSEKGTIEAWSSSPRSARTVVSSPSLNFDSAIARPKFSASTARESYLVDKLIKLTVQPVPALPDDLNAIDERSEEFGKAVLTCLEPRSHQASPVPTLCMVKSSNDVRVIEGNPVNEVAVRNAIGTFRGVTVGLDLQISYIGREAITGKVTTLEGSKVPEARADSDAPGDRSANGSPGENALPQPSGPMRIPGGVIAGKRISYVQPDYPFVAKAARLSGTVVLCAVIGKDGKIQNLAPIASTDPMFTEEATRAVSKWTYAPYLLNGEPTEVATTITVNFAMNH